MKNRIVVSTIILLFFFAQVKTVKGIQIEISGNGASSVNEVQTSTSQNTVVEQSNSSEISNNVVIETNTGGNEANGNTAEETTIETGDTKTEVIIENNANSSNVTNDCCKNNTDSTISIINNGSESENTITHTNKQTTNITINNSATIQNTVNGSANTGNNHTNNNGENSTITTGSITASETILNKNINNVHVSADYNSRNIILKISQNGSGSFNTINSILSDETIVFMNNFASISNKSEWDLNSGNNSIIGGFGDATISTGNIDFDSKIITKANDTIVDISCCKDSDDPSNPDVPGNPDNPSNPSDPTPPSINPPPAVGPNSDKSNNNNDQISVGGAQAGRVLGMTLPATGLGWWAYATLANILMLLMGLYLRKKAGRSPSYAIKN